MIHFEIYNPSKRPLYNIPNWPGFCLIPDKCQWTFGRILPGIVPRHRKKYSVGFPPSYLWISAATSRAMSDLFSS